MTAQEFVPVFHGHTLMEAQLIKGLLEGEGIFCRIPGELATEPDVATHQVTGGRQLDVRVAPADLDKAREVIQRALEDGKRLKGFLAEHPDGET